MIVYTAREFISALDQEALAPDFPALPRGVLMIEPAGFFVSPETARDNRYMDLSSEADPERALAQFRGLVEAIRTCGVPVTVFPGRSDAPDAVFPNNVFATIPGRLIIGHMRYPGRQRESDRPDILEYFAVRSYSTVDLREQEGVAELTGALVIDRARNIGFCGLSERADRRGAAAMHEAFDLRLTYCFDLAEGEYHTNVVLSVLAGRACMLYPGGFADRGTPEAIAAAFPGQVAVLDRVEKDHFAGNCIALTETDLFMSRSAAAALRPVNRGLLESWGFAIHAVELDELEKAGGSLRCMTAEIF
jgi:hypothetical protein